MTLFTDSNVILPEPDPREHCQLPAAQVAHGSTVEMSRSSAEPEAFHRDITFVDTQGFRDELIMEVDTPSWFLVLFAPCSSDYPHSARTDKQWSFHTISGCASCSFAILGFGLHIV